MRSSVWEAARSRRLLDSYRAAIGEYKEVWGIPPDREAHLNAWAKARALEKVELKYLKPIQNRPGRALPASQNLFDREDYVPPTALPTREGSEDFLHVPTRGMRT